MNKRRMNKYFKQLKKYQWLWLAGLVIVVLIVVLVVVVNAGGDENSDNQGATVTEVEAENGTEGSASASGAGGESVNGGGEVVFKNSEFLEDFLGVDDAKLAVQTIDESVLEFIGDDGNYTAFVAGSDLEKGVSFPFDTLEFTMQVSNGENFDVAIALKKDAYFGMLVRPMDGGEAKFFVRYLRPGAEAGYTEGEAVRSLRKWAESTGAQIVQ